MQRKYAVWIEGKPLLMIEGAHGDDVIDTLPTWVVGSVEEVATEVKKLSTTDMAGLQLIAQDGFALWDAFKGNYKFVLAAGGVVNDEQGRLLVIRRLGKWDLPKGKVDEGEGIEAAAIREVQEECGLRELRILHPMPSTWHTYERKGKQHLKRTDWFLMHASSSEVLLPQTDEDIEEVKWIARAELDAVKRDTYPSLLAVIEAWERRVEI